MLLWIAIILLCDAGLAFWHEHRIVRAFPRLNVKLLALIETIIAGVLTLLHFARMR